MANEHEPSLVDRSEESNNGSTELQLVQITDFIAEKFSSCTDTDGFSSLPLGLITFAGGKKAVALADNGMGQLLISKNDLPEGFDLNQFIGGRGRIINLNRFDGIKLGQIGLADVDVISSESIYDSPSVAVRMAYQDLISGQKERTAFDEEEILKLLTSEAGGIAVFKGGGLDEENALVLEKAVGKLRYGLVFFIHPEVKPEERRYINSVAGVREFFLSFNEEFNGAAKTPFMSEMLSALRQNMAIGSINFKSNVRAELFKAQVIANARLAEVTGEQRYHDFLKANLETSRRRLLWDRGLSWTGIRLSRMRTGEANKAVDTMILGEDSPNSKALVSSESIRTTEKGIYAQLTNEYMRNIRRQVEARFGDNIPAMHEYLNKLADLILTSTEKTWFDDIEKLLIEFRDFKYRDAAWAYELDWQQGAGSRINFDYSYLRNLRGLVADMMKRIELQRVRHFIEET